MQRVHFYRAHGAWHLRYRANGKQVSVKLADCTDEYRTLKSVRPLAEPYLQTANSGRQADGHLTLQQYAETVYFPHAKKDLKPSTYKGYFNLYAKQVQPRSRLRAAQWCASPAADRFRRRCECRFRHAAFPDIRRRELAAARRPVRCSLRYWRA